MHTGPESKFLPCLVFWSNLNPYMTYCGFKNFNWIFNLDIFYNLDSSTCHNVANLLLKNLNTIAKSVLTFNKMCRGENVVNPRFKHFNGYLYENIYLFQKICKVVFTFFSWYLFGNFLIDHLWTSGNVFMLFLKVMIAIILSFHRMKVVVL